MLKVMFMAPSGEALYTNDMTLEQLYALKLMDIIDIEFTSYCIADIAYNVNNDQTFVWLK